MTKITELNNNKNENNKIKIEIMESLGINVLEKTKIELLDYTENKWFLNDLHLFIIISSRDIIFLPIKGVENAGNEEDTSGKCGTLKENADGSIAAILRKPNELIILSKDLQVFDYEDIRDIVDTHEYRVECEREAMYELGDDYGCTCGINIKHLPEMKRKIDTIGEMKKQLKERDSKSLIEKIKNGINIERKEKLLNEELKRKALINKLTPLSEQNNDYEDNLPF